MPLTKGEDMACLDILRRHKFTVERCGQNKYTITLRTGRPYSFNYKTYFEATLRRHHLYDELMAITDDAAVERWLLERMKTLMEKWLEYLPKSYESTRKYTATNMSTELYMDTVFFHEKFSAVRTEVMALREPDDQVEY